MKPELWIRNLSCDAIKYSKTLLYKKEADLSASFFIALKTLSSLPISAEAV